MQKHSGIGIIINENKQLLILLRSEDKNVYPNHRCLPGGRGDEGEKPEETCIREVMEETSLIFEPIQKFMTSIIGTRKLYRFLGKRSGTVSIQEESKEAKRASYQELKNLPLAFDLDVCIEKLYKGGIIN